MSGFNAATRKVKVVLNVVVLEKQCVVGNEWRIAQSWHGSVASTHANRQRGSLNWSDRRQGSWFYGGACTNVNSQVMDIFVAHFILR